MPDQRLELHARSGGPRTCPYCRAVLADDEAAWDCPRCETRHHLECASENERCAIHGCGAPAPKLVRASSGAVRVVARREPATGPACAGCRAAVAGDEPSWQCPECLGFHHLECAQNLGRCASCNTPWVPHAVEQPPDTARLAFERPSAREALARAVFLAVGALLLVIGTLALADAAAPTRGFSPSPVPGLLAAIAGALGAYAALFVGDRAPLGNPGRIEVVVLGAAILPTLRGAGLQEVAFMEWLVAACVLLGPLVRAKLARDD